MMQAIAGIHYNFSMPMDYWPIASAADGHTGPLQDYITERYLGMIRNFHAWSWLLIYLFGASPAVCASFLRGRGDHPLRPLDEEGHTLYLPYATSLRMGDLGYNSSAQRSLRVCYNSLDNYLATLTDAILTPHPAYAAFRGKRDGEYMQLNDSLLQIENEFYSTIRPKRPSRSGETALTALYGRGIEYVEVRCIDVNPFLPLGIDATAIRFLDSFLLFCLTAPSPACDEDQQLRQAANRAAIVNRGREPGLTLHDGDGERDMRAWGEALLDGVRACAALLDADHGGQAYADAVDEQVAKLQGAAELPSARLLRELGERGIPYSRLALDYSNRWAEHFRQRTLDAAAQAALEKESEESLARQRALERADTLPFEAFLEAYYEQYRALRAGV